jgi:urease accessory protein
MPKAAPMSPPRRFTATITPTTIPIMGMITVMVTGMTIVMIMLTMIIPTTAMRIIAMAITRTSAPRHMCMDPAAATIIMTTITTTTTIPTAARTRVMDASSPEPSALAPQSLAELPLLLWLSPAFPVGSFAYSHGLEWAVEAGDIVDAATLRAWLGDLIEFGAPRSDAILFACAFRAVRSSDWAALAAINELAIALSGSAERRLETSAQGVAFVAAMRAAWSCEALDHLPAGGADPIAYPVAVGAAAAGHRLDLHASLEAFVLSLFANFVSAAVRLGAIGQTDGQKTLAAILPDVRQLALAASQASLDDLGSCAFHSDIAAIRHETQYSRLFRS